MNKIWSEETDPEKLTEIVEFKRAKSTSIGRNQEKISGGRFILIYFYIKASKVEKNKKDSY